MASNGDSPRFDFNVTASQRAYIECFARLIRKEFPKALPAKRLLNIEKVEKYAESFYEMNFSFNNEFDEILDDLLEDEFPDLIYSQNLYPGETLRIEMIIKRSNLNEYTYNTYVEKYFLYTLLQ